MTLFHSTIQNGVPQKLEHNDIRWITVNPLPVTVGKWEIKPNVKSHNVDIIIKGERKQGNLYVEISVFEQAEQLSLFTD